MIKKIPWKNILIVFTAMLVVPVIAFAITTADSPKESAVGENSNIIITSDDPAQDQKNPESASEATTVLTAGALGYIEGSTRATDTVAGNDIQTSQETDAVSSATGEPGATGDDDEDGQYEDSDDEDEDDDAIKEDEDEDEDDGEDAEDEEDEEDDD